LTVIVVSFFESVFADHSKDHPVAVAYFSSDTHTSDPYTTLLDSTRIAELERENRELRRANEILRTASAFFAAAELDRKLK
jgi:transposase-like protein